MDNESLPVASSHKATNDAEVLSRRTFMGQGETQEAIRMVPEGETSAAGHLGEQIPLETGDGGHIQFVPQPILFRRPMRLRHQASTSLERRRCTYSAGDLCPSRGTGYSTGSTVKCFHC